MLQNNILDCSISHDGTYMATSAMDSTVRIWDLRNWKCVATHRLSKGAHSLEFSQTGKLATAFQNNVLIWKGW